MIWEEKSVTDFVTFQRGFDLPREKFVEGDYPVIGSTSILGYHNKAKVKGPGVVMGRSGTLGMFQYVRTDFWPHNTTLWIKEFNGNDRLFAYYALQTLDFIALNGGGAVPTLNRNFLDSIFLKIPPLPTQRKIAGILSAYDDLIENNLKRIKLLEEAATYYYISLISINKTSAMKPLRELVNVIKGRNPKKTYEEYMDGYILYLLLDSVERNKIIYTDDLTLPQSLCSDVLMCMDGARSGLVFRGMNGAIGSTMAIWRCKENILSGEYLYQYLKQNLSAINQGNTGAAIPHANRNFILDMNILIPNKAEFDEYQRVVSSIVNLINTLYKQNSKLREARNVLLPRLMSGEIEV